MREFRTIQRSLATKKKNPKINVIFGLVLPNRDSEELVCCAGRLVMSLTLVELEGNAARSRFFGLTQVLHTEIQSSNI